MSANTDTLVIGCGAAGAVAAVAASRKGHRVMLIGGPASATSQSSGAIDVADILTGEDDDGPLARGVPYRRGMDVLASTFAFHPYARIGVEGRACIDDALSLLAEIAAEVELRRAADAGVNLVLATDLGITKRAAMAQRSVADGDLASAAGERLGVVSFAFGGGWSADAVTASLRSVGARAPEEQRLIPVALPVPYLRRRRDSHLSRMELARHLDDPEAVKALAASLDSAVADAPPLDRLLMPALIGIDACAAARFQLQALAGLPITEACSRPPSPPGQRLHRALLRGLAREGIERIEGLVTEVRHDGDAVRGVSYQTSRGEAPRWIGARRVIIATGGLASGGIQLRDGLREPLMGLPVVIDGRSASGMAASGLLASSYRGAHPLMRAGVRVDELLRPLDASGTRPVCRRLFAAGGLLAGNDPGLHKAGLGLCALTGYLAGAHATSDDL